jgi:hypothetical protein
VLRALRSVPRGFAFAGELAQAASGGTATPVQGNLLEPARRPWENAGKWLPAGQDVW